ncbi:MAG TPA: 4Fe-4S ferredoxin [Geoalkalibacter subterraneus]|uniref:4Fe-4S ferredoxin n=1 Tax=Geoalkalibacter subterraneus TaxID=483547 RepID=A0A831LTQ5_9BACT|nr:4Fe-4S ferredoxin [Geoalkalibacter subterraneus]
MKVLRKIIRIDDELCNGCGLCVPDCAEGSLQIIDGKARLVADNLCDGLGACLGSCPTGALQIIEREAEDFSEEAVHKFLADKKKKDDAVLTGREAAKPYSCPSAQLQTFAPVTACQTANKPALAVAAPAIPGPHGIRPSLAVTGGTSVLIHWPVQIRLVPPSAPFLQNADLLVAADCTAISAPNFQTDFLAGKVVMMGCPKFDDAKSYVQRFAEIIATSKLNSLTILIMEVPCCSSMVGIIKAAIEQAGNTVPVEQITLSTRGGVIARTM